MLTFDVLNSKVTATFHSSSGGLGGISTLRLRGFICFMWKGSLFLLLY